MRNWIILNFISDGKILVEDIVKLGSRAEDANTADDGRI